MIAAQIRYWSGGGEIENTEVCDIRYIALPFFLVLLRPYPFSFTPSSGCSCVFWTSPCFLAKYSVLNSYFSYPNLSVDIFPGKPWFLLVGNGIYKTRSKHQKCSVLLADGAFRSFQWANRILNCKGILCRWVPQALLQLCSCSVYLPSRKTRTLIYLLILSYNKLKNGVRITKP